MSHRAPLMSKVILFTGNNFVIYLNVKANFKLIFINYCTNYSKKYYDSTFTTNIALYKLACF